MRAKVDMLSKNKARAIVALRRKKERLAECLFLVEGAKSLDELLASRAYAIETLVFAESVYASWERRFDLGSFNTPIYTATPDQLARISTLEANAEGLAVVAMPDASTAQPVQKGAWALALDGIRDPGNLGTLLRTADWFGITHVYVSLDCAEWTAPKTIAASMGSFCRIIPQEADLINLCREAGKQGVPVYGAVLGGEPLTFGHHYPPGLLVLGSESHGISVDVLAEVSSKLTIPRRGGAESLNVGVAGGVLMAALVSE